MSEPTPRISVITAAYNALQTLPQAFASLDGQSWRGFEHVVVDGASSDGTAQWLAVREAAFARFISEPDQGVYFALNKGLAQARGEVVGFLHADDLLADAQVLLRVAQAFEDPEVDVVYGDLLYVRRDDPERVVRVWKAGAFDRARLREGWMPPHPTVYMRRRIYEQWGGFDTRWRIAADYEHVLRVFKHPEVRVRYLPEVLVHMRVGGLSNRSLGNLWRKSQEDWAALRHHGLGGTVGVLRKNLSKVPQFLTQGQVRPSTRL